MSLSTKEYWEKRFIRNALINEKSALEYEKDLKKSYEATIASIKKEVEAFYGRYAEEGDISLAWAKEKLRPDKLHDFHMQAKKYLDEVEKMGDKPFTEKYEAHLKKLSGKAYVSQMDELVTNIRHNIETLSTGYNIGLGQTLENAYEEGFYRTMHDIQNRTKVGVSFTTPGGKQLEQAVKSKWLGENYSDRIWNDKEKLIKQLEPLLSQEFVRGRGSAVIAQELAGKLGVSYNNARRLIRTEMNHISNEAAKKAYEESGVVNKYMFMATLDNRTSEVCSELDGKVIDVKEGVAGVNMPPMHPYCRSTTVPYFEDDDIGALIESRIARTEDGSGRSIALGENLNFKDWVEKYGSDSFKARMAKRSPSIPEVPAPPEEPPFTAMSLSEYYGTTGSTRSDVLDDVGDWSYGDGIEVRTTASGVTEPYILMDENGIVISFAKAGDWAVGLKGYAGLQDLRYMDYPEFREYDPEQLRAMMVKAIADAKSKGKGFVIEGLTKEEVELFGFNTFEAQYAHSKNPVYFAPFDKLDEMQRALGAAVIEVDKTNPIEKLAKQMEPAGFFGVKYSDFEEYDDEEIDFDTPEYRFYKRVEATGEDYMIEELDFYNELGTITQFYGIKDSDDEYVAVVEVDPELRPKVGGGYQMPEKTTYIANMVAPVQGKGYGKAMMYKTTMIAEEQNGGLGWQSGNDYASEFYKRLGFDAYIVQEGSEAFGALYYVPPEDIKIIQARLKGEITAEEVRAKVEEKIRKEEERRAKEERLRLSIEEKNAEVMKKKREAAERKKKEEEERAARAKQIPKSLKNHEEHVEKFLKNRDEYVKMSRKQRAEVEQALAELIDNSVFAMRVPDLGVLDSIMSSHFKNQFETNTSGGALNQRMRTDTAKKMFGIDPTEMEAVDYEKYGYLSSPNVKEDFSNINGAQFYGRVRITFKRENVIDRTTFSAGDSLGFGQEGELVPPRVNKPSIAAFAAESVTYSDFGRHVKSLKANSKNVLKASDAMQNDYFELQYHGDLTIDDVETVSFSSFIINRYDRGMGKYDKLRKDLMRKGIKVNIIDYTDEENKDEEDRIRKELEVEEANRIKAERLQKEKEEAERKAKEEAARREEAARLAAEEAKRLEEEARKAAEEAKKREEERLIAEAARLAEEERIRKEEEERVRKQEEEAKRRAAETGVQGKDLTGEYVYDPKTSKHKYDIEDILEKQGFDGKPKVVSKEEFDEIAKKSKFYAERSYSADSMEVLDTYRDELYNGKFYVDASVGGAQYGQGMYCASIYDTEDSKGYEGIRNEMVHYRELGKERGFKHAYTEALTLQPDAKVFEIPKNADANQYVNTMYSIHFYEKQATDPTVKKMVEKYKNSFLEWNNLIADPGSTPAQKKKARAKFDDAEYAVGNLDISEKGFKSVKYETEDGRTKFKNIGTLIAEMGYDAIKADGHGESGSYTVILNRTKLVIREGGANY